MERSTHQSLGFLSAIHLHLAPWRLASAVMLGVFLAVAAAPEARAADPGVVGPIDLNTATESQLETLKGVGDVTAKKIIAGRPYQSVDELVGKGVPQRTVDAIRPLVTVGGAKAGKGPMTTRPSMPTMPSMPAMPSPASSGAAPGRAMPATGLIDINGASESELQSLPGIGPATSKAIVAGRPYGSVDDLAKVKGIGPAKIAAMRDLVTVGSARKASAPPAPSGAATPAPMPRPMAPPAMPAAPSMPSAPAMPKSAGAPANSPLPSAAAVTKAPGQAASAAAKLAPGQRLNLNTASATELEALPGIGPVKAQKIVAGRPYTKIEDVMKVPGIKEGTFAKIKDAISVE